MYQIIVTFGVTNSWRLWKWLAQGIGGQAERAEGKLEGQGERKTRFDCTDFLPGITSTEGMNPLKIVIFKGGHNRDRVSMVVEWLNNLVSASLSTVQEWVVWALVCSTCLQRSDRSDIPIVKSWCVSGGWDCWATEPLSNLSQVIGYGRGPTGKAWKSTFLRLPVWKLPNHDQFPGSTAFFWKNHLQFP